MDISNSALNFIPIYGKIPVPIPAKKENNANKEIESHSSNAPELPLEIIYIISEYGLNDPSFLAKLMKLNISFHTAVRGLLLRNPDAQMKWVHKGFDQYDIRKMKNNAALACMNIALDNISHVSFSMDFDDNLINQSFNDYKMLAILEKQDIKTLHLNINSKFSGINESAQKISEWMADRIAATLRKSPLEEINLSVEGKIFSAADFVKIFQAMQEKESAKIKISLVNCIIEDLDLEKIAPHLIGNIVDFKLIQNRYNFNDDVEGDVEDAIAHPLPTFALFNGNFVNAKKITIQVGHIDAEDVKNIEKIVSVNTVELSLAGINECNEILFEFNILGGLGDQGVKNLVPILKNVAKNLKIINLSSNNISDDGIDSLLDLASINNLKEINLSINDFSIAGVARIISSLLHSQIEYIDLSNLYQVSHDDIKIMLECMPGIAKIYSDYSISDGTAYASPRVYKKTSYQKENGRVINILTSKGLYWNHERAVMQLEFMKSHHPENAGTIEYLENMVRDFAEGREINYVSEGSDDEEFEDASFSESEAYTSSDTSKSDGSIPEEMASLMHTLDFNSANN